MSQRFVILFCFVAVFAGSTAAEAGPVQDEAFRRYWYDQGAELTRYRLEQARYGERRQGEAVLIYVTEPFDVQGQVKSDDAAASTAQPALKLNLNRSFLTGVYPYHTMRSTFQPMTGTPLSQAWKSALSVQEWCGQVFEQWNRQEDGWRQRLFSYFQSEGDRDRQQPLVWLEDELWTRLRVDPSSLPTGAIQVIPGALARRFAHRPATPVAAVASWSDTDQPAERIYGIELPWRSLAIRCQRDFPYAIEGWVERIGEEQTTATRTHRQHLPYWRFNAPEDAALRDGLGLPTDRP